MARYFSAFQFTETKEQAERMAADLNKSATPYQRKNHPAHFTPWSDGKGTDIFIVWYSCKR